MKAQTVQRILTALACAVFIISILTPFLEADQVRIAPTIPEAYGPPSTRFLWSFRSTLQRLPTSSPYALWSFITFWSQAGNILLFNDPYAQWAGPFFVTMFLTQILTVLFGLWSAIKPHLLLLLISTILSAATVASIYFIDQALSDFYYTKTPQAGYFLTVASTALFLIAFLWKTTSRQQPTSSQVYHNHLIRNK